MAKNGLMGGGYLVISTDISVNRVDLRNFRGWVSLATFCDSLEGVRSENRVVDLKFFLWKASTI